MIGEGKKLRFITYNPFNIVKKIGTNAFQLDIPSYMQMYSVINVESLNIYEPTMIMDYIEGAKFPTIDEFTPE